MAQPIFVLQSPTDTPEPTATGTPWVVPTTAGAVTHLDGTCTANGRLYNVCTSAADDLTVAHLVVLDTSGAIAFSAMLALLAILILIAFINFVKRTISPLGG